MRHLNALSWVKDKLSRAYPQTRCPLCWHLVFVDGNGNMEEHGSGAEPCAASGLNDYDVARKLDLDPENL